MKPSVYIETTIPSYLVARPSRDVVLAIADNRLRILRKIPILPSTHEVESLSRDLIQRMNLPQTAKTDAYHIAIASVYGMDFLLTWNCTHINNMHMQRLIEITCQKAGYSPPVIGTPEELI